MVLLTGKGWLSLSLEVKTHGFSSDMVSAFDLRNPLFTSKLWRLSADNRQKPTTTATHCLFVFLVVTVYSGGVY